MDGPLNWREVVQLAPHVKDVQAVLHDYVEAMAPSLDTLPEECRRVLQGEFDVQTAAVTLLQAELRFSGPPEVRALLHEVAYTFASAAVRMSLLHSTSNIVAAR